MINFLHQNQGKISFKAVIFGLALVLIMATSGFSIVKFVKKMTEDRDLTAGLPIVFAADQEAIFKIDLGQTNLAGQEILNQSDIDIAGPGDSCDVGQCGQDSQENFEIVMVLLGNGEYQLKIKPKKPTIKPGRYQVSAKFVTPDGLKDYSQDFYWGVLALNTNKSVYLPHETAYLQMAVLDDEGSTLCDAELKLKIKNKKLKIEQLLSTQNGSIVRNPQCGPNNVIDTPDYYAFYQLGEAGVYQIELIAETENGSRLMQDYIEVRESVLFEVERIGPTRIYPPADYQMRITVKANQDFQGEVVETAPAGFGMVSYSWDRAAADKKIERQTVINMSSIATFPVVWSVNWQAGQTYQLSYTFDAPDISPEFYLLGPLQIGDWQEARHWQIASDATDIFNYTGSCTDPENAWTDEGLACDYPSDDTHATRDVPPLGDTAAEHILASGNNASSGGAISVVEIGVECYSEKTINNQLYLIPVFDGITDGAGDYNYLNDNTIDDDVIQYFTITTDGNGPGDGNWQWSDIQNLDIKVWSYNNHGSQARMVYIDRIVVRVTHDPLNYAPSVDSVTDSPDPVSPGQAITFSVDWSDPNTVTTSTPAIYSYYAFVCDDGDLCSSFMAGTFGVGGSVQIKGDVRIKGGVRIKKH